jgi:hypothetical protein
MSRRRQDCQAREKRRIIQQSVPFTYGQWIQRCSKSSVSCRWSSRTDNQFRGRDHRIPYAMLTLIPESEVTDKIVQFVLILESPCLKSSSGTTILVTTLVLNT